MTLGADDTSLVADVRLGPSPVMSPTRRSTAPTRGRARPIVRVSGEILITLGLVILLFAAYEVYGKASAIQAHQSVLSRQLDQTWAQPTPAGVGSTNPGPVPGTAIGRMYIPVMKLHWVVVEGVALDDIRYAPGHYPGTAMPGQVGNFSVAGHRIPPLFWNLQEVQPGDQIVVQTKDYWYVYRVTVNEIVTPHSIEVVAPTPDHIGVAPTTAMLTLTTCNPKWNNYQRMVVHAELVTTTPYRDGPPMALGS